MYGSYISDVLQQVDEVMKFFAMEKELRIIKNRGHFPVPLITPQGTKIETPQDKDKVLEAVDTEVMEMIKAVRESEEIYEREQEEARNRDKHLRLTRQTSRSDFNFLTMMNITPIRNKTTRTNQHQRERAVHFDTNAVCHIYLLTNLTTSGDRYEPPVNDSIIQGAGSTPGGQFAMSSTGATGHNEPWRYNNGTNTATHTYLQTCMTRPSGHNGFHNNSPNSSDNRNGPTCFRCGEQGHMRLKYSKDRLFCIHCRTPNYDTKACRKQHNSTPSPTNSHTPTGYHLTATTPPLLGTAATGTHPQQTGTANNGHLLQNYLDTHQPRTSTTIQTPFNGASPVPPADMTEATNTNHSTSCQQQQKRRHQQADDEEHKDL